MGGLQRQSDGLVHNGLDVPINLKLTVDALEHPRALRPHVPGAHTHGTETGVAERIKRASCLARPAFSLSPPLGSSSGTRSKHSGVGPG